MLKVMATHRLSLITVPGGDASLTLFFTGQLNVLAYLIFALFFTGQLNVLAYLIFFTSQLNVLAFYNAARWISSALVSRLPICSENIS